MVDLFSGLGGASYTARERGWQVTTIDAEQRFAPDVVADLSTWTWPTEREREAGPGVGVPALYGIQPRINALVPARSTA